MSLAFKRAQENVRETVSVVSFINDEVADIAKNISSIISHQLPQ